MIPLSTPVVALLFLWGRRFGLYDHAIFVTYSLCFMMLLVTVLTVAGAAGLPAGWIVLAIFLAPPLHMYKQLRGTYQLRRFSAAWRMVVLIWSPLRCCSPSPAVVAARTGRIRDLFRNR